MVGCVRKINLLREPPKQITCRNYRTYEPEKMIEVLRTCDWLLVFKSAYVNEACNHMVDILSRVFNRHAPKIQRRVKGKAAPLLSEEIKRLMNGMRGISYCASSVRQNQKLIK